MAQQAARPGETDAARRASSAAADSRESEAAAIDEMQATITALELRVKELETRLAKEAPASTAAAQSDASATAPATAPPAAAPDGEPDAAPAADPHEFAAFVPNPDVTGVVG